MAKFFFRFLALWAFSAFAAIAADLSILPAEEGATLPRTTGDGQWGYVDRDGNWQIEPQFEFAHEFSDDGLARVKFGGKEGFIDRNGDWVIEPLYDVIKGYDDNGRAFASIGFKTGAIDRDGNWIIEPSWNIGSHIDKHGVTTSRKDGKVGFIDLNENWLIPPTFKRASTFFKSDFAVVFLEDTSGVIDRAGNWVIEPQKFRNSPRIHDRDLITASLSETEWLLFDKNGNRITDFVFEDYLWYTGDRSFAGNVDGRWGIIDEFGEWRIEPQFAALRIAGAEDLWPASLDGKTWGVLNKDGTWKIEPSFDKLGLHRNGFMLAQKDEKTGFIDTDGNWAFVSSSNHMFEWVDELGNIPFAKPSLLGAGLQGLMDMDGNVLVSANYFSISYKGDGLYEVTFPNFLGKGYLDANQGFIPIGFGLLE